MFDFQKQKFKIGRSKLTLYLNAFNRGENKGKRKGENKGKEKKMTFSPLVWGRRETEKKM